MSPEELIIKHYNGELTPEEDKMLQAWLDLSDDNRQVFGYFMELEYSKEKLIAPHQLDKESAWKKLLDAIAVEEERNKTISAGPDKSISWQRYRPVAALIAAIAVSVLAGLISRNSGAPATIVSSQASMNAGNISPGSNKATLTLNNGDKIALDSTDKGLIACQGNARIEQSGKGRLEYNAINKSPGKIIYNTLTTPRAAQFQVVLPDGSRIWLNSSSTLRYPTAFADTVREVELNGEAYFEVFHNPAAPFIVKVASNRNDLAVQALGTSFNIKAYDNEHNIRTTLLSGQVSIDKGGALNELKPGQQAQLDSSGQLHISEDPSEGRVMAWKDGNFYFERADIQTVMRTLARWYDVDVKYNGHITYQNQFVGLVSKNMDLSKVLDFLRQNGIHLTIEGKKIIVSS